MKEKNWTDQLLMGCLSKEWVRLGSINCFQLTFIILYKFVKPCDQSESLYFILVHEYWSVSWLWWSWGKLLLCCFGDWRVGQSGPFCQRLLWRAEHTNLGDVSQICKQRTAEKIPSQTEQEFSMLRIIINIALIICVFLATHDVIVRSCYGTKF